MHMSVQGSRMDLFGGTGMRVMGGVYKKRYLKLWRPKAKRDASEVGARNKTKPVLRKLM